MKYASKARVHVIKTSRLYALICLGSFIAFWNWAALKSSRVGQPSRLSSLIRLKRRYKFTFHEYNDDDDLAKELPETQREEWTVGCPEECGASRRRGICDGLRCICYEGYGAMDCAIGLDFFYDDHDVYRNLTLRPLDLSGWDNGGNIYRLLVQSLSPYLVVEIGVWKGASAMKLAAALKEQGFGVLVAVDMWLPIVQYWINHHSMNRKADLQFQNGYPTLFYTFLSNVVQLNLTEFVIPMPTSSRMAAETFTKLRQKAELIHIDAGHSYVDVAEDIMMWWEVLRKGGVLLGDDWSPMWPGVPQAVREHAKKYNLPIHRYKNKWWVYKKTD